MPGPRPILEFDTQPLHQQRDLDYFSEPDGSREGRICPKNLSAIIRCESASQVFNLLVSEL